jgi:hypothetical protein
MRLTAIISWPPDKTEAIYKRFEAFGRGNAPDDVKKSFGNLNIIAWEKLTTNRVLSVVEGEEEDIVIWNSYWQDIADFEIIESSYNLKDQEALQKFLPPGFLRK